ncbi:MAG: hypothetical protein AB9Q19_12670 [Candidatus Reddybacter sp.]
MNRDMAYPFEMLVVWLLGLGLPWWGIGEAINLIGVCWGWE